MKTCVTWIPFKKELAYDLSLSEDSERNPRKPPVSHSAKLFFELRYQPYDQSMIEPATL